MKVPEKPLKNIKNPKMVYLVTLQVQKTAKKGLKKDFFLQYFDQDYRFAFCYIWSTKKMKIDIDIKCALFSDFSLKYANFFL